MDTAHPFPPPAQRPDIGALIAARAHCRIVHHVPGRIRLRFDPLGLAGVLAGDPGRLHALLGRLAGIQRTEVNPGACSLVVHYDHTALPSPLWERILTGSAASAAATLEHLLSAPAL